MAIGTKLSGYAPPQKGPFKCGHCEYFSGGRCKEPTVVKDPALPKDRSEDKILAIVEASGCCNFYEPKD